MGQYDPIFDQAAREWNLDPTLLKALSATESGGRPGAVSGKGAQGLMQVMPQTARGLGVTDPADPAQNIYAGAKYLSQALDAEKTPEDALRYYHGGPGWRGAYGPESAAYAPAVTANYQKLAALAAPPRAAPPTFRAETPEPTPGAPAVASTKPAADPRSSYDDFLARTGASDVAAPAPDHSAFLARTGAADAPPVAPVAPNPDAGLNEYGITDDPQQYNNAKGPEIAQPAIDTAKAVAEGAKAGFGSGPIGWSPENLQAYQKAGVVPPASGGGNPLQIANQALLAPLAAVGNLGSRVGSALMGGYQAGAVKAGEVTGNPLLGRDLAALPEAFPTGDATGGLRMPVPEVTAASPNPLAVSAEVDRPYLSSKFSDAPVAPGAVPAIEAARAAPANPLDAKAPASPVPGQPQPAVATPADTAPPGPRSAGAAASTASQANMTPKETQAYRSTAEGQKLLEPQPVGVRDNNSYVPGSIPNSAEMEQTVNSARELKSLNVTAPQVSQEAKEVAAANNDARQQFFSRLAGSPVDTMNAEAARSAQAETDLASAFGSKKPTDAQPVAARIKSILADPRGSENTALQQYVKPLLDRLTLPDGTLKSDPEQLYGLREDISRMQSKAARAETPTLDHVTGQLADIKSALDSVIENGAPGYKQYLDNYSQASRGIDVRQALQAHEPKLYDAQNRMGYNRVQGMMRQIVDSRNAPGLNQYKSIPDETMQQLWNLRDDLRRSASSQELARAPGSDTTQNAWDAAKHLGKLGGSAAMHAGVNYLSPGLGSIGLNMAKNALAPITAAKAARKQTARGMAMLRTDPSQLRNPLAP